MHGGLASPSLQALSKLLGVHAGHRPNQPEASRACVCVCVCVCLRVPSGLLFRPFPRLPPPAGTCGWTWQPGPSEEGRDSPQPWSTSDRGGVLSLPSSSHPHPVSLPVHKKDTSASFGKKRNLLRNLLPKKNFQPVSKYLVVHNSVLQKPCYTLSLFVP